MGHKLKMIRLYKTEDVPDHILEEITSLMNAMLDKIGEATVGHDINVIVSAFNRVHAALIVSSMTEDGLLKATRTEMIGLMKNVEHISGQSLQEEL